MKCSIRSPSNEVKEKTHTLSVRLGKWMAERRREKNGFQFKWFKYRATLCVCVRARCLRESLGIGAKSRLGSNLCKILDSNKWNIRSWTPQPHSLDAVRLKCMPKCIAKLKMVAKLHSLISHPKYTHTHVLECVRVYSSVVVTSEATRMAGFWIYDSVRRWLRR